MNHLNKHVQRLLPGIFTGILIAVIPSISSATPYGAVPYNEPYLPTTEAPLPPPLTRGKEFSHEQDRDAAGVAKPGQDVLWDGSGGTKDGNLHALPTGAPVQVDAISNSGDRFFDDAVNNATALLFSTRRDTQPGLPASEGNGCGADPVCFETTGGVRNTWATDPMVDDMTTVNNLDGLEVWGDDVPGTGTSAGFPDANRFSGVGDAANGGSVFTQGGGVYITQTELAAEVIAFMGLDLVLSDQIDVDAMMTFDRGGSSFDSFDIGDSIMFSLWPIFDSSGLKIAGDEVFVWDKGQSFGYLSHGGHLWDTNWLGYNVDALEAGARVPAPAILSLLSLGLLIMLGAPRKRTLIKD